MKKGIVTSVVFAFSMFFAVQAWAHGLSGFGRGGHVGGFHGRGGHFGGSHFSGGFGRFGGFHHGFGPRHFGPLVPFGHGRHFAHEQFFGPHHHFGHGGFGFRSFGTPWGFSFRSFGFSGGGFSSRTWVGPAGPPPLGAPGPTPFAAPGPTPFAPLHRPIVIIRSPFFCFPHGLEFTDQALFISHLHQFHGVPLGNALSFCQPVGGGARLIFFGF